MGKSLEECYKLLGLDWDASEEQAKKAYKKLALECHPDKNPDDPEATSKFQELGYAYRKITKDEEDEDDEEYYYYDDDDDEFFFDFDWKRFFYFLFREEIYSRVYRHHGHCSCGRQHRQNNDEDTFFEHLYETGQDYESEDDPFTEEEMAQFRKFETLEEQREFNKRTFCAANKSAKAKKETKVNKQPKTKSSKQLKAEQWKREKEISEIAEQIEMKKDVDGKLKEKESKANIQTKKNSGYNFSNVDLSHLDGCKKKKTQPKTSQMQEQPQKKKKKKKSKHGKKQDDIETTTSQNQFYAHSLVPPVSPPSTSTGPTHSMGCKPTPSCKINDNKPQPFCKIKDNEPKTSCKINNNKPKPPSKIYDNKPKPSCHFNDNKPPRMRNLPPRMCNSKEAVPEDSLPSLKTVPPPRRNATVPPSRSNIWQKRQENQYEVQRLQPSSEEEERRQLEIAIQMSVREAEIEERNRKIVALEEALRKSEVEQFPIQQDTSSKRTLWKADTMDSFDGTFPDKHEHANRLGDSIQSCCKEGTTVVVGASVTDTRQKHRYDGEVEWKAVDTMRLHETNLPSNLSSTKNWPNDGTSSGSIDSEAHVSDSRICKGELKSDVEDSEATCPRYEDDLPSCSSDDLLLDDAVLSYQVKSDDNICPYGRDCCLGKKCNFTHPPQAVKKQSPPCSRAGLPGVPMRNVAVKISDASWEMSPEVQQGLSLLKIQDQLEEQMAAEWKLGQYKKDDAVSKEPENPGNCAITRMGKSNGATTRGRSTYQQHNIGRNAENTEQIKEEPCARKAPALWQEHDDSNSNYSNECDDVNEKAPLDGRFADLSSNESSLQVDGEDWDQEINKSPCSLGFESYSDTQNGIVADEETGPTPPGFDSKSSPVMGIVNPFTGTMGQAGKISVEKQGQTAAEGKGSTTALGHQHCRGQQMMQSPGTLHSTHQASRTQSEGSQNYDTASLMNSSALAGLPNLDVAGAAPLFAPGLIPNQGTTLPGQGNSRQVPGNMVNAGTANMSTTSAFTGIPAVQQLGNVPGIIGQGSVTGNAFPTYFSSAGTAKSGNSTAGVASVATPFSVFPGMIPSQATGMRTGVNAAQSAAQASQNISSASKIPGNLASSLVSLPGMALPLPLIPGMTLNQTLGMPGTLPLNSNLQNIGINNVSTTKSSQTTTGLPNFGFSLAGLQPGVQNANVTAQVPLPGSLPGSPLLGMNQLVSPLALQLYYQTLLQMQMTGLSMSLAQPSMPGLSSISTQPVAPVQNPANVTNMAGQVGREPGHKTGQPSLDASRDNLQGPLQVNDLRRPSSVPRAMACSERRDS